MHGTHGLLLVCFIHGELAPDVVHEVGACLHGDIHINACMYFANGLLGKQG